MNTKVRTAVVWSLITGARHPSVTKEDSDIDHLMPLIEALFSGIELYTFMGYREFCFYDIMNNLVIPVLKKCFSEIRHTSAEGVGAEDEIELKVFLSSRGYEWQDDPNWMRRFQELLST
jgi:hypothetical protein